MKKEINAGTTKLPIALLYLDDVEEFYNIFAREGVRNLRIVIGDQTLESIGELDQLRDVLGKNKVRSFAIRASDPSVSIHQDYPYASISYDAESTNARGIESRLREKWHECRRLIDKADGWITITLILAITWSIGRSGASILLVPVAAFVVGFAAYGLEHMAMRRSSTIVLMRRKDVRPFWQPNRDKILLIVLTSALTLVVTVGGWFIYRYFFGAAP
jgi:hypothetical protein